MVISFSDELFLNSFRLDTIRDQKVRDTAVVNDISNFEFIFTERFDNILLDRVDQNSIMAFRILNDTEFKKVIVSMMLKRIYDQIRREMGVPANGG